LTDLIGVINDIIGRERLILIPTCALRGTGDFSKNIGQSNLSADGAILFDLQVGISFEKSIDDEASTAESVKNFRLAPEPLSFLLVLSHHLRRDLL
jgi:hypothetical protein